MKRGSDSVVDWLLEKDNPSVRYFALTRLLGAAEDEAEAAKARRAIMKEGWVPAILAAGNGDGEAPAGGPYDRNEMCWGRHSCHMGVVKALKALSARSPGTARPKVGEKASETIRNGVEYILAHRVHKKSHSPSEVSRPGWLKFGFPLMYQSDVLEILWILAELGSSFVDPKEERLADALEAVEKARGKDGRWSPKNSFNGCMRVDVEMKGAPSKWLTLRALRALSAFG